MASPKRYDRIAFVASAGAEAQAALAELTRLYGNHAPDTADIIVAIGGDGLMLETLHRYMRAGKPIYGMHRGTVGFLMNNWQPDLLELRIQHAKAITVLPLRMDATTVGGQRLTMPAINEVSLLRETRETAKIEILVDGRVVLPELACDGVLVSSPAGSTAYNLSAQGPILPLDSSLLALTPISPFRPRRWRGAILPNKNSISFRVLDAVKRPVSAVADQREVRDVSHVSVSIDRTNPLTLLFDPEHALDDRITMEQFAV